MTRVDHAERRGVGPLGDQDVDGAPAIDERVAGFDIGGVGDRADIADEDRAGSVGADWDIAQFRASVTTEFTGTIGISSPMRTLPDGLIVLPFVSAWTTSSGLML